MGLNIDPRHSNTNSHETEDIGIEWPDSPQTEINYEQLNELFKAKRPQTMATAESFHRGSSRRSGHSVAMWSLMASVIDGLIVFALSSLFLLTFSFLVHGSLNQVLQILGSSLVVSLSAVMLGLFALYLVMLRSFLGYSIGEWACGLRMGSVKQRLHRLYTLKIILRVTLIYATGVALIPLLSLLTGKDIAGKISGVELTSLR